MEQKKKKKQKERKKNKIKTTAELRRIQVVRSSVTNETSIQKQMSHLNIMIKLDN